MQTEFDKCSQINFMNVECSFYLVYRFHWEFYSFFFFCISFFIFFFFIRLIRIRSFWEYKTIILLWSISMDIYHVCVCMFIKLLLAELWWGWFVWLFLSIFVTFWDWLSVIRIHFKICSLLLCAFCWTSNWMVTILCTAYTKDSTEYQIRLEYQHSTGLIGYFSLYS